MVSQRSAYVSILLAISASLALTTRSDAATINAASVSFIDVNAAVSAAVDGDTVIIPPGTASWPQTLDVSKSITIQGANVNATDDRTVILDDIVLTGSNLVGHIFSVTVAPTQAFRVTGITFRVGSRTAQPGFQGAIVVNDSPTQNAPSTSLRIDHCHFDRLNQIGLRITGWFYGVVDHCQWDTATTGNILSMNVSMPTWGGAANEIGNGSWADSSDWGSERFIFIEDNIFNNNASVVTSGCIDCEHGGRYVCRSNTFKNTWPGQHGTESGGYRGGRAFEIYNNTLNYPNVGLSGNLRRSGAGLVFGNSITAKFANPHVMSLTVFRENGSSWIVGGANGTNIWDVSDSSNQTGNGYGGGQGGLYSSGSHSGVNGSTTLTVSGTPWAGKDWTGYMVTNLDQVDSHNFAVCAYVTSNTANTMTFAYNSTGTALQFNVGDRFEVRRVTLALDQPGRGRGDLCTGATTGQFHNVTTGTDEWPHQALEPWYCWNNSLNGTMNHASATLGSDYPTVQENREYYNYNSSWQIGQPLTTGVASGTLANRPNTCSSGVAFWATDTSTLYQCSSTNAWTTYYTPYPYPHPLVSGIPGPPSTPTNLHVM